MSIHYLNSSKNEETVEFLERLLRQAKTGELAGMVFCANIGGKRHVVGAIGAYQANHCSALSAAGRLSHWLHSMTDETEEAHGSYNSAFGTLAGGGGLGSLTQLRGSQRSKEVDK